ncbi:MAG TPA: GMC family oxidoreductase N-terminal domain-containing protein, partial [Paracoccaceae bacterium]|nr:GMC family oxidoreductase N-terminal domain-containing protein [Paracoccaceae bacterium]
GRVLGGSSAINGAIVNRGHPADFDHWAALGNSGWSWAEVLPYFRRLEDWLGEPASPARGRGGPLPVSINSLPVPVTQAFFEAAVAAGLPRNPDQNAGDQFGIGASQGAIRGGWRHSSAHAFLHPARRLGVKIVTRAPATRIEFEGARATGVRYRAEGSPTETLVQAKAGVILAAGAVGSPKLLQLSGIGPAALLGAHGIAVRHELAGVGENLADHYTARLVARGRPGMDGINGRVQGWRLGIEILRWLTGRPSALGISPAHVHVYGKSAPELPRPDWFLVFSPGSYRQGMVGKLDDFPGLSCGVCALRPESRGHVRIRSADPAADPLIQPNYLAEEADRRVLLAVMRAARTLISSPAMRAHVEAETMPGCEVQSDDELLDFARATGSSAFHLAGTCRMGVGAGAVVGPGLAVHGVDRLFVADASVMPTLVSANTCAATMMIAEKAADLILGRAAPSAPG